jgi:hypothetical protein
MSVASPPPYQIIEVVSDYSSRVSRRNYSSSNWIFLWVLLSAFTLLILCIFLGPYFDTRKKQPPRQKHYKQQREYEDEDNEDYYDDEVVV